jgi:hypothetical protein
MAMRKDQDLRCAGFLHHELTRVTLRYRTVLSCCPVGRNRTARSAGLSDKAARVV